VFERTKTYCALDRAAALIGFLIIKLVKFYLLLIYEEESGNRSQLEAKQL
jgi:hypothetical protein